MTTFNSSFQIHWQFCRLEDLSAKHLYKLLAAREAVFVVEQRCAYQELDGLDFQAMHLIGWSNRNSDELVAYLRILPPGTRFQEPSIGRVLTASAYRRQSFGKQLMTLALDYTHQLYPKHDLRISAQCYLEDFYRSFDFQTISSPYPEDDILHIEMIRKSTTI